jgi:CHAT domain-containing protein
MEWLTLRDVFLGLDLQGNAVTVLNGCDSGLLQPEMTDEYLNLPAGFLYAGARCVISTLWPVDDLSSSLLMERFYKEMQNGKAPAAALREAQRWIREDIKNGPHLMERILPPLLQNLSDPQLRMNCFREAHRHAVQFPEQPPFQSPSYWAPFICTGAGY